MPVQQQQLTPEQQRIYELFKNNNPQANFTVNPVDPIAYQDVRTGDPAKELAGTTQLQTQTVQPNTTYQSALRNRFAGIEDLGRQQTAAVYEARQRQQIAAQQSYGSGQTLGQQTQYDPNVGGARGAVLSAIAKMAGTPYSWGGGNASGPTRGIGRGANTVGFDCSGLVQYAYAQIGMKMPRLAEQQATMGTRVPINKLRPGDLVAGPHHIAVYAGNGMMWESPRTGSTVRLAPVRGGMVGVALGF